MNKYALFLIVANLLWLGLAAETSYAQSDAIFRWNYTVDGEPGKFEGRLESLENGIANLVNSDGQKKAIKLSDFTASNRKRALIAGIGSGVVQVECTDAVGQESFGSGFFVGNKKWIATNYHVVRGAVQINVSTRDGDDSIAAAHCVAVDYDNDLAIIAIKEEPDFEFHVLKMASQPIEAGASVWTIGHPSGLIDTVSWGDVNAVRTTNRMPKNVQNHLEAPSDTHWIQTDAVIAQGSSGGPLMDSNGNVVGINTLRIGANVALAVEGKRLTQLIESASNKKQLQFPIAPGPNETGMDFLSAEVGAVYLEYVEDIEQLQRKIRFMDILEQRDAVGELHKKYRSKYMAVAEQQDPTNWIAFQAVAQVCSKCQDDSNDSKECFAQCTKLLLDNHLDKPGLRDLVMQVAQLDQPGLLSFLTDVSKKSADKQTKAFAKFAICGHLEQMLNQGPLQGRDELKKNRETIIENYNELASDYGDIEPAPGVTMEMVANQMQENIQQSPVGNVALELSGVDVLGNEMDLEDFRGKVVLLDFFADWCPHCKKMYPFERKLVESMKDEPFELLGVNTDSERTLRKLVDDEEVTWKAWADGPDGPISERWKIESYPTIYLIDHEGVIRRSYEGAPESEDLMKDIRMLLSEIDSK